MAKKIIDEGIKHAPEHYRLGTFKIKNMRDALDSDVTNYIVNETQKKAGESFENLFGSI